VLKTHKNSILSINKTQQAILTILTSLFKIISILQKHKPMQKNPQHQLTHISTALFILAALQSCHPNVLPPTSTGDWIKKSELSGNVRTEAATFTINNMAYVGTGYNGIKNMTDFWAYDASQDSWTQITDFPGAARGSAVAFAIGTQGYVGTGYDQHNMFNDFYRYDINTKNWTLSAPFAGTPRYDAVAFAINNKGYVTTGFDGTYQKDFWQYDPTVGTVGTWTQKTSFGGDKRSAATAFVVGTKAYITTGVNNGTPCSDLWYYDATADSWTEQRRIYNATSQTYDDNYTDIERDNAVSFVIGDTAYLVTGENGPLLTTTWAYIPTQDQWIRRSPIIVARQGAVGFALNGYGYFSTGKTSESAVGYLDDIVQLLPNKALNLDDYGQ
jgi:N-acetylneuraminic acid mutarotase